MLDCKQQRPKKDEFKKVSTHPKGGIKIAKIKGGEEKSNNK